MKFITKKLIFCNQTGLKILDKQTVGIGSIIISEVLILAFPKY